MGWKLFRREELDNKKKGKKLSYLPPPPPSKGQKYIALGVLFDVDLYY